MYYEIILESNMKYTYGEVPTILEGIFVYIHTLICTIIRAELWFYHKNRKQRYHKINFILQMFQYREERTHHQKRRRVRRRATIKVRHQKRMILIQIQPQMQLENRVVLHPLKNRRRKRQEQLSRLINLKN